MTLGRYSIRVIGCATTLVGLLGGCAASPSRASGPYIEPPGSTVEVRGKPAGAEPSQDSGDAGLALKDAGTPAADARRESGPESCVNFYCEPDGQQRECVIVANQWQQSVPNTAPFVCYCDRASGQCQKFVAEKVPCRRNDECWTTWNPVVHPIPRPKGVTRRFRPCEDGETDAICVKGECVLGRTYGC